MKDYAVINLRFLTERATKGSKSVKRTLNVRKEDIPIVVIKEVNIEYI